MLHQLFMIMRQTILQMCYSCFGESSQGMKYGHQCLIVPFMTEEPTAVVIAVLYTMVARAGTGAAVLGSHDDPGGRLKSLLQL